MKTLIIYFTGTYNTKYLVEKIKERFTKESLGEVEFLPIDGTSSSSSLNSYDLIFFSYPIYAFNTPIIFDRFIKRIKLNKNQKVIIASSLNDYNIDLSYDEYKKLINKARRHLNYLIDKGIICWFIGYCLYIKNCNQVKYVHYYDPEFEYITHLYELTIPPEYKRKDIFELPYCTDITKIDDSILKNVACPYYKIKRVNIIQALIDDFNLQRFII